MSLARCKLRNPSNHLHLNKVHKFRYITGMKSSLRINAIIIKNYFLWGVGLMTLNIGARYKIIGRITNGTSVISYVLVDLITGERCAMEKGMVEQYALNKQIYNCTAQIYGNKINMKGIECKLSQLPRYNCNCVPVSEEKGTDGHKSYKPDILIVGKVHDNDGRTITHYVVVRIKEPERKIKVDKDRVLMLAKENRIINAKSQSNCGELMLRAKQGYSLSNITSYVL